MVKNVKDFYVRKILRDEGWSNDSITPFILELRRKFILANRRIKNGRMATDNPQS